MCLRKINVLSFLLFTILLSSWIVQMLVAVNHKILIQFFAALFWIFTSTLGRIALNFLIKIWEALVLFCIALVRMHTSSHLTSAAWWVSLIKTFEIFYLSGLREKGKSSLGLQCQRRVRQRTWWVKQGRICYKVSNLMSETREDLLQG